MKNDAPLVTVYIPCRNYGRFLTDSVTSVFEQLYENWELIIVDEGSTDDTYKNALKLCQKVPERCRVIKNDVPVGLQKLANQILNQANGQYLVRLDADDWLHETALLLMVAKLERQKDAGLIYGNYYYTDEVGKVLGVEQRHSIATENPLQHFPPHGACTMFRTRSLKCVGGYLESANAQDGWDLWYKLSKRIGAINIDQPIFFYRQHNNSLSKNENRLLKARSKIFSMAAKSLDGDYKLNNIIVLPVKDSYPNFKKVPFKTINGVSLLERAILSAVKSKRAGELIISSSSEQVLSFAEKLEMTGSVPKHHRLVRDPEREHNKSLPIRDIMIDAGEYYKSIFQQNPDTISFISLHAINRSGKHIDDAINILRVTESDSVFSVLEEREPIFLYGESGINLINEGRFKNLVFEKERLFQFNGAVISTWWEILKNHRFFGDKYGILEMSKEESQQVKNEQDLKRILS